MTTATPSPNPSRPPRRARPAARAAAALTAAVVLLGACGASGGSDSSGSDDPTTTAAAPATTASAAPASEEEETTTSAAGAETDDPEVFVPGEVLYASDLQSPAPGGWSEGENFSYGPSGLTVSLGADASIYATPKDLKVTGGVMVEASFPVGSIEDTPDAARGVACRSSAKGAYVAAVTESPTVAGDWTWGVYRKDVEADTFEQLMGTGMDSGSISAPGTQLTLRLGCNETELGEQLQLYVGEELAGVVIDIDPIAPGGFTSAFAGTQQFAGDVVVTSFTVSEMVPA
jgi:hypothetical protein